MHRLLLLGVSLMLTSCSLVRNRIDAAPNADRQGSGSQGAIERQLADTALSIEKSLQSLAAAQDIKNAPLMNTAPLITAEGGMGGTAEIDWAGPVGPLVQKLASMSDYRLKTLGTEPPIPIIVTVNARNAVLADILQNAAHQAGRRASIMVFPETRVIELRYHSL